MDHITEDNQPEPNEGIIYVENKATTYSFYNKFLGALSKHYSKYGQHKPPVISFEQTEYIDLAVLGNLIGTGLLLKRFHGEPIELILNYRPKLLFFLYNSRFFELVNSKTGKNIFKYDEEYVGGFSADEKLHHYGEHVIHRYNPTKEYYKLVKKEERDRFRLKLVESLRGFEIVRDFAAIVRFYKSINSQDYEMFLDVFSELLSNAILYSLSESYATVFSNKYKTILSLSDMGIGFEEALLKKKNFKFDYSKKLKSQINYTPELKDFVIMFEVFNYSRNRDRFNLWSLKNMVIAAGGIFRLHYWKIRRTSDTDSGNCRTVIPIFTGQ